MPRHARNVQASRSSLRVATVRSLQGAPAKSSYNASTPAPPSRSTSPSSSESDQDEIEEDASRVPRLDKAWVIYDLSGKAFTVNPVPSGGESLVRAPFAQCSYNDLTVNAGDLDLVNTSAPPPQPGPSISQSETAASVQRGQCMVSRLRALPGTKFTNVQFRIDRPACVSFALGFEPAPQVPWAQI